MMKHTRRRTFVLEAEAKTETHRRLKNERRGCWGRSGGSRSRSWNKWRRSGRVVEYRAVIGHRVVGEGGVPGEDEVSFSNRKFFQKFSLFLDPIGSFETWTNNWETESV